MRDIVSRVTNGRACIKQLQSAVTSVLITLVNAAQNVHSSFHVQRAYVVQRLGQVVTIGEWSPLARGPYLANVGLQVLANGAYWLIILPGGPIILQMKCK